MTSVGWSKTMTTLADRVYTGSITLTDAATNVSSATAWTFTIDTTAPTAPTITSHATGALIKNATPTFSGA